jgi:lysophospholipase L1-like esterase
LEYNTYAQKAKEAAVATGAQFLHIGEIVEALAAANNQVGWGQYLLDWIHPSALGHQFLASRIGDKLRSPNLSDSLSPANNLGSVQDSIVFLEATVPNE